MKWFKGAGEKRKFFNNLRHFGPSRQVAVGLFAIFAFVPIAALVFAVVMAFKHHPVGSFAGASGVGLAVGLATSASNIDPATLNAMARAQVLAQSVEMIQPIFSKSIDPTQQLGPIGVDPQNVGLIKRFWVSVSGTIQNTDAAVDAVATPFGISNLFTNINYKDYNGTTRIDTFGWHVAALNTSKGRWPYASALQQSVFNGVSPFESAAGQYGANFPVMVNLTGLTHGTNKAFRMVYDVPLAYSDDDLRGAVYSSLVNAQSFLNLTINPNPFVATGQDDTQAVLRSGTCSFLGNLTINVYQVYLDQLPVGNNGKILPQQDLGTIYELKTTAFKAIQAGHDFPISFTNFRDFLSTVILYNNTGSNDGHGIGADINYWALTAANSTQIFKLFPLDAAQRTRDILGLDFPPGTYYFSFRRKPINTLQYGNMALQLNAITAGANAYMLVGWEDFAYVNTITQAGSLPAS